jgi:cobalt-precorrin 5A hydrolase
MHLAILALTKGGHQLADTLAQALPEAEHLRRQEGETIADQLAAAWSRYDGLVCIMAAGIVVRSIAPLLRDKTSDPCVAVVDERGRHAISLVGGHLGGGNALARRVAAVTGGAAVITTASDTLELVVLDLWARDQHLLPPSREQLTAASALLVNRGYLLLYSDETVASLPPGLIETNDAAAADIIISAADIFPVETTIFRPRTLVIGVGCNRHTPAGEMDQALTELLRDARLSRASIRNLSSIDKKNDEPGLLQFAADNGWPLHFFSGDELNTQTQLSPSPAALKAVGAIGVAEPAALLSAATTLLEIKKRKWTNVTMALARAPFTLSAPDREQENI